MSLPKGTPWVVALTKQIMAQKILWDHVVGGYCHLSISNAVDPTKKPPVKVPTIFIGGLIDVGYGKYFVRTTEDCYDAFSSFIEHNNIEDMLVHMPELGKHPRESKHISLDKLYSFQDEESGKPASYIYTFEYDGHKFLAMTRFSNFTEVDDVVLKINDSLFNNFIINA